ncbi:ribosome biogenesis GTPase Der [Aurantivibrio infirmus]
MLPVIALVGRPNVGKSTLFNRLTKTRDALVANFAGLTRDRKYGDGEIDGQRFILIDTGGLSGDEEGVETLMVEQSWQAIREADIVLFILDSRDGLHADDLDIGKRLRVDNKKVFIVANKIDGLNHDLAVAPFFELGLGEVFPITATHGRGVRHLMESVLATIPKVEPTQEVAVDLAELGSEEKSEASVEKISSDSSKNRGIKIGIVGRPNVGKSTLVNRLLGEDRVVVFDMPGTTRDSVYIDYERHGKPYTLIDTAGIRKRKNIKLAVEKFSIVKTLQAIEDANVVILVVDASEGLVDQDLHLMGNIVEAGRALVVAVNKWDGLDEDKKNHIKRELDRRLKFIEFADLHFISALHGTGVGNLYKSVESSFQSAITRFTTNQLTRILEDAVSDHPPPLVRGRRIKLRYAHTGGHNPPIIVIHGNQTDEVPSHYVRYLEKVFRRALKLHGTPLKIQFKTADNPFSGKKNKLTDRQKTKKRRLVQHVKKAEKKKKDRKGR